MVPGGDADHEDGDDGVQHRGGHRGVGGAVEEGQEPAHFKKYMYIIFRKGAFQSFQMVIWVIWVIQTIQVIQVIQSKLTSSILQ